MWEGGNGVPNIKLLVMALVCTKVIMVYRVMAANVIYELQCRLVEMEIDIVMVLS